MKKMILTAAMSTLLCGVANAEQPDPLDGSYGDSAMRSISYGESLIKQNAYFEASQVVGRFFLCIPHASNFKDDPATLGRIEKCFEETTDINIVNDIGGTFSYGRNATLQIATQGLATLRKDVAFSLSTPYISKYARGPIPGTGTIELTFNSIVHQNITALAANLPFDASKLGPQLFLAQDYMSLKADKPGQWKITVLKVVPLLTQVSPNIVFREPFPAYPIDSLSGK